MKKYFVFNGTISGGSYFLRSFLQSYLIWFFGLGLYLRAVSGYKRASALFKDDTIKILFTVNTVILTLLSTGFGYVFVSNSYDFSIFFIDAPSIIFNFLFISSLIAHWYLILKDSEIKEHSEGMFTKANTPYTSSEEVAEPINEPVDENHNILSNVNLPSLSTKEDNEKETLLKIEELKRQIESLQVSLKTNDSGKLPEEKIDYGEYWKKRENFNPDDFKHKIEEGDNAIIVYLLIALGLLTILGMLVYSI